MELYGIPDQPSLIDSIHYADWVINEWKIVFLFSDKQLSQIQKQSTVPDWWEDPIVTDIYVSRLNTCFNSMHKVYLTLGILAQAGDRLFDQETGMLVQNRSFDSNLMTITYTLSI